MVADDAAGSSRPPRPGACLRAAKRNPAMAQAMPLAMDSGPPCRHICVGVKQGATANSDWSRGHAWAMYGWTAVQRYLRDESACSQQYTAANAGVMESLLTVAVDVSESFLQMLPTQLQVSCYLILNNALAARSAWHRGCRHLAPSPSGGAQLDVTTTFAGAAVGLFSPVACSGGQGQLCSLSCGVRARRARPVRRQSAQCGRC